MVEALDVCKRNFQALGGMIVEIGQGHEAPFTTGPLAASQMRSRKRLPLQFLRGIHIHGQMVVVEVQHDGQSDGGFGGSQHDDKQGEDHTFDFKRRVVVREGNEVDIGAVADKPTFNTVGLPDTAVRESRDRVKAALKNCGYDIPASHIILSSLAIARVLWLTASVVRASISSIERIDVRLIKW